MTITVVLGAQWGDEGKGKLVDILCPQQKLVCRAQGGNNAGHTIKANGKTYDFHMLPSGLLNPHALNLIGSGCVINLPDLFEELKSLEKEIPNARERLVISDRAHVVLRLHQKVDGLEELELADGKIGTTGKGIGPTYSTKASRNGIRISDVIKDDFEEKVRRLAAGYKKRFGSLLDYDVEEEIAMLKSYRVELEPLVCRRSQLSLLVSAQQANENILVEGANALMLDIDAGTYPFVTSSNTGLGGVFTGLSGINPMNVQNIIGVVKAYTTRVGGGPFPTEDLGEAGNKLQEIGREFGVTTGRRRRCGWLDLVVVKYSTQINCYTTLNLTKIDVLDTFEKIKIAVKYKNPATKQNIDEFPADLDFLGKVEVEYVTLSGWQEDITKCRSYDDLPLACREYIEFIENYIGVRIGWIGVGPEREAMIIR